MEISIGIMIGICMCWISEMIQHNVMKKYIKETVRKELEVWEKKNKKNLSDC